jgi:hypothetical protein
VAGHAQPIPAVGKRLAGWLVAGQLLRSADQWPCTHVPAPLSTLRTPRRPAKRIGSRGNG